MPVSLGRRENLAFASIDQFANDLFAWLELPRLNLPIIGLVHNSVDIAMKMLSPNGSPYINSVIDKTDEYLRLVAHGISPLPSPY
jgi:hypothetical protein